MSSTVKVPAVASIVEVLVGRVRQGIAGALVAIAVAAPLRCRGLSRAWGDAAALAAFIGESPDRGAMSGLRAALPGFRTTRWTDPGGELLPTWDDALPRAPQQPSARPGRTRPPPLRGPYGVRPRNGWHSGG